MINHWFIDLGYVNPPSIIAGGPVGADCHDLGHGELRTGEPVIVDIFPRNETTLVLRRLHALRGSWRRARRSAPHARGGLRCQARRDGRRTGRGDGRRRASGDDRRDRQARLQDGAAAGRRAGRLLRHDPRHRPRRRPGCATSRRSWTSKDRSSSKARLVTIEPGLYRRGIGGVRVEDIVLIHADRCESLNKLPEGLDWK